jgi:hypothetical protein
MWKENGWWELWGLIKHDELKYMGCLVAMRKEVYQEHKPQCLKTAYCHRAILNLQNQSHKTKQIKNKKVENLLRFFD